MALSNLISLILILALIAPPLAARPLDLDQPGLAGSKKAATETTLVARLRLNEDGSTSNNSCWDSLFQLQSCTGEVIIFFLNGETRLGPGCCKAVGLIEEFCWPNMIASLGFTAQEEQVLRGYCEKENAGH